MTDRMVMAAKYDVYLFLSKIRVDAGGCFISTLKAKPNGYVGMKIPGTRIHEYAHRISWLIFRGSIPEDLIVCHKCDVRNCANPAHLFLGTYGDNLQDAVKKNRMEHGSERYNAKLSEEMVDDAILRFNSGESQSSIARSCGVSPTTVNSVIRGRKWKRAATVVPSRSGPLRGEMHLSSKLTEDDVREIRLRAGCGETRESLAVDFGVSSPTVTNIVNRVRWKHVA